MTECIAKRYTFFLHEAHRSCTGAENLEDQLGPRGFRKTRPTVGGDDEGVRSRWRHANLRDVGGSNQFSMCISNHTARTKTPARTAAKPQRQRRPAPRGGALAGLGASLEFRPDVAAIKRG